MNACIVCTDADGREQDGYCEFCPNGDYPPRDRVEDVSRHYCDGPADEAWFKKKEATKEDNDAS